MQTTCACCGSKVEQVVSGKEIYPHRQDLYSLKFYLCDCGAYVGTHKGTEYPLGTCADAALRTLRGKCHKAFDPLWKHTSVFSSRADAYAWLYAELKVAHIAEANKQQCKEILKTLEQASWQD